MPVFSIVPHFPIFVKAKIKFFTMFNKSPKARGTCRQSSSRPTQTARPTMRTRSASWSVVQASMGG